MAMIEGIMYPPVLDPILPAIDLADVNTVGNDLKMYFQAPRLAFVSNDTIATWHMQVSLVNVKSNSSMIDNILGIALVPIEKEDETGKLYIKIPSAVLKGEFLSNTPYRIQMRFDKHAFDGPPQLSGEYLQNNYKDFSEWSTSCLLRFTETPKWYILPFDKNILKESQEDSAHKKITFNRGLIKFTGDVYYGLNPINKNMVENDTLDYYYFKVFSTQHELVYSSQRYTPEKSNPRAINCSLDLESMLRKWAKSDDTFIIKFYACTKLGVKVKPASFTFQVAKFSTALSELVKDAQLSMIETEEDKENGLVRLTATIPNFNPPIDHICLLHIMRSSSLSNYEDWEIIKSVHAVPNRQKENLMEYSFVDNTVQSFTTYRYKMVIEQDPETGLSQDEGKSQYSPFIYGITKEGESRVQPNFYFASLVRRNVQLPLKYNFNVSSLSRTINRVKFDTLGGKYPKFTENANMDYKQLQISGLISAEADEMDLFINKQKYLNYQESDIDDGLFKSDYGYYVKSNDVDSSYDYFWEREFREEALKWLNDGEPKLFRSQTEGNLIVMLNGVSLQPYGSLSRRLYAFSATAYEIGEANDFKALEDFGIVKPVEFDLKELAMHVHDHIHADGALQNRVSKAYSWPYLSKLSFSNMGSNGNQLTTRYSLKNYVLHQKTDEYVGRKKNWSIVPDSVGFSNVGLTFFSLPKPFLIDSSGKAKRITSMAEARNISHESQIVYGYKFFVKNRGENEEREVFVPAMMREKPLLGQYNLPVGSRTIRTKQDEKLNPNLLMFGGVPSGRSDINDVSKMPESAIRYRLTEPLEKGAQYTLSGDVVWYTGKNMLNVGVSQNDDSNLSVGAMEITNKKFKYTFTYPGGSGKSVSLLIFEGFGQSLRVQNVKLEKGDAATSWCPSAKEVNGISEKIWKQQPDGLYRDIQTSYYYLPDPFFQYRQSNEEAYDHEARHLYYGYYNIPASVELEDIIFDFSDDSSNLPDMVACDAMLSYAESTIDLSDVVQTTIEAFIVSQISGIFNYNENIVNDIKFKHTRYVETEEEKYSTMVQWLKGMSIEADPYSAFDISYRTSDGEMVKEKYVVGGSGKLALMKNFKIEHMTSAGKYLTVVPNYDDDHKPIEYPSLELWEAVHALDEENGHESLSEIVRPRPQTIYTLQNGNQFIYYGDGHFYEVYTNRKPNGLVQTFAKIPIQGVVNYCVDVLRLNKEVEAVRNA